MTESGKFRGVRTETGIETPEYRHSGVDFDYFLGELNQLNMQIERIQSALARIKEPDIRKDPAVIASFWEKMAPEIQKKEEERKKLLGRIGILQSIILEFDKPENGMPKALAYIEQNLEGIRDPDDIADEIKAIAAARDEIDFKVGSRDTDNEMKSLNIDNRVGSLHDNVKDAKNHLQHVRDQIREVEKKMDENVRLQEIKNRTGLTEKQRLAEVERLMESDRVLSLQIKQRHEYENRKTRYERHLQEYQQMIIDAEKERKAGFRRQSELKEEYKTIVELLQVKEALEKRMDDAKE